jgi:hypothetical protein
MEQDFLIRTLLPTFSCLSVCLGLFVHSMIQLREFCEIRDEYHVIGDILMLIHLTHYHEKYQHGGRSDL